jgi:hypothetical protein
MTAPPPTKRVELEHVIQHSDLALCVVSGQGVLRCPDMPIVVDQEKSGTRLVIVTFVAPPNEVRPYDVLRMLRWTWKLKFFTGVPTICL